MPGSCFSAKGPSNLVKVNGIMKKEDIIKILKQNIKESAEKLGLGVMGRQCSFQLDNNPKHTAKVVKTGFAKFEVAKSRVQT